MTYYSTEIEKLSEICGKNRKIDGGSEQTEETKIKYTQEQFTEPSGFVIVFEL